MKSKHTIALLLIILMSVFLFSGCAGRPIKVGVIDQQSDHSAFDFTKQRSISASASGFQLLLFFPININDRQKTAYQKLMRKAGPDYVTDLKIKEAWTYALVGTIYTTTIEATAYPRK